MRIRENIANIFGEENYPVRESRVPSPRQPCRAADIPILYSAPFKINI